jgi:hypothetical protein
VKEFLSTREVAAAANLDPSTVRGMLMVGDGPAGTRTARGWQFSTTEVVAWLARRQAAKPVRQVNLPSDPNQPCRFVWEVAGQAVAAGPITTGEVIQMLRAHEMALESGRADQLMAAMRRVAGAEAP